ncbi:MAG: DUF3800 domain-containing protein [Albidovulum sp.]|nr:DUF3800 domain-containing protein [Albidovulum sp.]
MGGSRVFNIYCDESCHLENDGIPVMALGAVFCEAHVVRKLSERIRDLKAKYGLSSGFEAKWTKISPAKAEFYLALVNLYLADDRLRFRGLVVPNKQILRHDDFDRSHDDWYYKMYFKMLRPIFTATHQYRIYLDVKDTRGGPRIRKLRNILANGHQDFDRECVVRVQQVRSHESELLQLADVLTAALGYANRSLAGSSAKSAVVARLRARLGSDALSQTSRLEAVKFSLLVWQTHEVAG